jgi:hypothetical protein
LLRRQNARHEEDGPGWPVIVHGADVMDRIFEDKPDA